MIGYGENKNTKNSIFEIIPEVILENNSKLMNSIKNQNEREIKNKLNDKIFIDNQERRGMIRYYWLSPSLQYPTTQYPLPTAQLFRIFPRG